MFFLNENDYAVVYIFAHIGLTCIWNTSGIKKESYRYWHMFISSRLLEYILKPLILHSESVKTIPIAR